jgi:transcription elongation factor S-II
MSKSGKRSGKPKTKAKGKRGQVIQAEPDETWRENVREKFETLVGDRKLADNIEEALYQKICFRTSHSERAMFQDTIFKHRYLYALQSLVLNLDPNSVIGNKNLVNRVISGELTPVMLVNENPVNLFPEKWEEMKKKQQEEEKFLYENQRKATSKRIKCFSCGKREVCTTEAQTRSADEPMTTFYECLNCNNRWRN